MINKPNFVFFKILSKIKEKISESKDKVIVQPLNLTRNMRGNDSNSNYTYRKFDPKEIKKWFVTH